MNEKCGLLGRRLAHSYSPAIHAQLGRYPYALYETEPESLADFLRCGDFHGLNVTIPYKKSAVPFCSTLSPTAQKLQSVNTLIRQQDGTLRGDNTDYDGFLWLVRRSGINASGKKALVLGSGGASAAVQLALCQLGARVTVISRRGTDNYQNLSRHADAQLLINATPVGMYPENGESPVDLTYFPHLEAVFDLIYNPCRTALLMQAERLGIPAFGGLAMLAAQARRSSELFQNKSLPDTLVDQVMLSIRRKMDNLILIGMPGSGKSTVAAELGKLLGRSVEDSDTLIEEAAHCSVPEIFFREGESGFRRRETEVLRDVGRRSGIILATGGGCIMRPENYALLHQNGTICYLRRSLDELATAGRPLSKAGGVRELYQQRAPFYESFSDFSVENISSPQKIAEAIKEAFYEICSH